MKSSKSNRPPVLWLVLVVFWLVFPVSVGAQPTQYGNIFTHFQAKQVDGRPFLDTFSGDFWNCMSIELYGNDQSRAQIENVFRGNDDVSEPFFNAATRCGFFYVAAPFTHDLTHKTVDLGLSISYSTPGITAQPAAFGRPPGIETIADPSAVKLPDGRIALYFSGDHRQAYQSTRWVTKEPITAHTQPLQFEIEQDYNLSERLLWRHIFIESDGSWTAFGDLDGFKKWTSLDGLNWQQSNESITFSPLPSVARGTIGLDANRFQFDAFISMERVAENEWIGVIPHYREGLDAEQPDPNGNGYDDPAYVMIYSSTDGLNWTFESHIIGAAEGFVEKLQDNLYAFSLYNSVLLSTDLKSWSYGLEPHFTKRGIALDDGYTLTFGTRSGDGIPTYAHQVDLATMPSFYTLPATYVNLPTLNQINGTNVGVQWDESSSLPGRVRILSVFPNPLQESGRIQVENPTSGRVEVELVDVLGRRVRLVADRVFAQGGQEIDFSVGSLPAGLYTIVVRSSTSFATTRIHVIR